MPELTKALDDYLNKALAACRVEKIPTREPFNLAHVLWIEVRV